MVNRRSRSFSKVLVAIIAGTVQPKPINMGIKLRPDSQGAETDIHDKGGSGHVSAILENGEEKKAGQSAAGQNTADSAIILRSKRMPRRRLGNSDLGNIQPECR